MCMSKGSAVPDVGMLGDFAKASADTARSHLKAAQCLLHGEFWGPAHAIAVIAFEEIGKAWLSTIAMLSPNELREEFPFGDLERNHQVKLSAARSVRALLTVVRGGEGAPRDVAEALADLEVLAREDNQAKQRGLYTDYVDGTIRRPDDITEEPARAMVAAVEDVLDNAGPLIGLMTAMWAKDNVPASVRSFLGQAAEAVQAGDGTMTMFMETELRNMEPLAGMLKDDPEWIGGILAVAEQLGEI
jgi:AbiV family abortive infection protein